MWKLLYKSNWLVYLQPNILEIFTIIVIFTNYYIIVILMLTKFFWVRCHRLGPPWKCSCWGSLGRGWCYNKMYLSVYFLNVYLWTFWHHILTLKFPRIPKAIKWVDIIHLPQIAAIKPSKCILGHIYSVNFKDLELTGFYLQAWVWKSMHALLVPIATDINIKDCAAFVKIYIFSFVSIAQKGKATMCSINL